MKKEIAEPAATCVDDVPDDVIELILRRLDSPLWLIRAASTCARWRGVIVAGDCGGAFLRRARSLHPPTIVGRYHQRNHPCSIDFAPSSPATLTDKSRFSLGFLDKAAKYQMVQDCHGGLVLLQRLDPRYLVVCDPLTRRHRRVDVTRDPMMTGYFFLLDGEDGTISASNFRVLHRLRERDAPGRSCVFSTRDNKWSPVPPAEVDHLRTLVEYAGQVDGCLYLGTVCGRVMVLDNTSLEFSKVHLPSRLNTLGLRSPSTFCVVPHCASDGDSCSPPTPRIVHVKGDELEVFRRVHNGSGGGEWVLEHSLTRLREAFGRLPGYPEKYDYVDKVVVGDAGFVVLLVYDSGKRRWPFCVCLNTMEVKVVPGSTSYRGTMDCFVYTLLWPPFMRASGEGTTATGHQTDEQPSTPHALGGSQWATWIKWWREDAFPSRWLRL